MQGRFRATARGEPVEEAQGKIGIHPGLGAHRADPRPQVRTEGAHGRTALATATPSCPVRGQRAAMEKVFSSIMAHTARWPMTRAWASGALVEPLSTISPSFSTA